MSFFKLRRTSTMSFTGINPTFSNDKIPSDGFLYEVIAGAIYGAVGAGILTAFGFSALSIPVVAGWCAISCVFNATLQSLLPIVSSGRWISDPSADDRNRDLVGASADFCLRVATVFVGCITIALDLNSTLACSLGAVVTEGVVEIVRAIDAYATPAPMHDPCINSL